MEIKSRPVYISATSIDCALWAIKSHLMTKYGCDEADRSIAPLKWYINTGRASVDFLRKLMQAKPFMVARKLRQGGSDMEIIKRIQDYIGYEPSDY